MDKKLHSDPIIQMLIDWAQAREDVRAALLTSTRTSPIAKLDRFSDYDVIFAVKDVRPYYDSREWLFDFGPMLVLYRDPIQDYYGHDKFAYITQYEDGLKLDITVMKVEGLHAAAADPVLEEGLDVGYSVLLDKDSITDHLQPPSYQAHIPKPPSQSQYEEIIELFFHEATYAVKHLWRGDLLPFKNNFDQMMKAENLRTMLEWRIEIDHDWTWKPGAYGKYLQNNLPKDRWDALANTYVGPDPEENWQALFALIDLFQEVAIEVGEYFGFPYPHNLHDRCMTYINQVRAYPPKEGSQT